MLIMFPRVWRNEGKANLHAANMLTTFSSNKLRKSSTEKSSIGWCGGCQPALLIKQSSRP